MSSPFLIRVLLLAVVVGGLGVIGAQEVTMPLKRFDELHARAHPSPTPTPAPPASPLDYSLDQAWFEIHAGQESARVVQELEVVIYTDEWLRIDLASEGTFIAADLGDLEGRVSATRSSSLMVRGKGHHQVRLELLVPLAVDEETTRPTRSLDLELPEAAVVGGVIRVAETVEEVELIASAISRGSDDEGGWLFVGDPGCTLQVRLLGRAQRPERSSLPLRFTAVSANLATISRTSLGLSSFLSLSIAQGSMAELRVDLPDGFDVISLDGDPVAGWNIEAGQLVVTPLAAVEESLTLWVALSASVRNQLASPLLLPQGAWQTLAASAVKVAGDGLLELVEKNSGRLPDERERAKLPNRIRGESAYTMVIPDLARPPVWEVTWSEAAEVLAAQVDRVLVDLLVGSAGRAAYQVWVVVRSTGATSITVSLPAGFELLGAGRDRDRLIPGITSQGLVLPLTASSAPQVVHLSGLMPFSWPPDGMLTIPIPALSAPASRVEARAILPSQASYELRSASHRGMITGPPSQPAEARKPSKLAAQAGGLTASGSYAPLLFAVPASHATVEAAWDALSSRPDSVKITVKSKPERGEWF